MTPERLAKYRAKATEAPWGTDFRADMLNLLDHIRDLETQVRELSDFKEQFIDKEVKWLTAQAKWIAERNDLEAQVREAREVPSIDDCLYHRCMEHWTVPGRNTTASSNGAECGACIERDWRSAFENYATHHGWCASGHGGMHVLGSPGSCDCGRDARLAAATPPSPEVK